MIYYDTFKDLSTEQKRLYLLRRYKCEVCKTAVAEGLADCSYINSCLNYCKLDTASDEELNNKYFIHLTFEKYTTLKIDHKKAICNKCGRSFRFNKDVLQYEYCPHCGRTIGRVTDEID